MVITITGRHMEVTSAIRTQAEEKARKLLKFYDLINQIEVILDGSADAKKKVEIIVHADRTDRFVAHSEGDDLYACIDLATHKLERQLTDHKERTRNRKHPAQ